MILDILLCHFYMVRFYALPLSSIPNTARIKNASIFYFFQTKASLRVLLAFKLFFIVKQESLT